MKITGIIQKSRMVFFFLCAILFPSAKIATDSIANYNSAKKTGLVYVFEIRQEIAKPAWKITQLAFEEAAAMKADYIIIHLNTYGGMVNYADSIRTKILNSLIPIIIFIDNQAISAGALISIAGDSIFMRTGGSIGAATVVNQTGAAMPDKYQSFMRSTMRATAEAHGKDTIINGNDTTYKWRRDPHIAEAMVDPKVVIEGLEDSSQVLTLTADEAIRLGYCEGKASSIEDVVQKTGLENYEVRHQEIKGVNRLALFFLNPIVQTILILLIIGGIYFELQAPGIGLPLGLAVTGALLYFFPLYIQGLAENWEILLFVVGLILLGLEIFVIPGFGVAGISGILLILFSLTFALIDNVAFKFEGVGAFTIVAKVFVRIVITVIASLGLSLWISKRVGTTRLFRGIALESSQDKSHGFEPMNDSLKAMIDKTGMAYTVLRPAGKVQIDEKIYDARAEIGFIDKGTKIKVLRNEAGQLYVIPCKEM
jgi:membrane-bound serine protease (ClpP class)